MTRPTIDEAIDRMIDASAAVAHAEGIYSAGARRELDEAIAAVKALASPTVAPVAASVKGLEPSQPAKKPAPKYPQTWVTDETPPRMLNVKGVALVDPDCLVAEIIGEPKHGPLWIVEPGGFVCGIDGKVYARPSDTEEPRS